MKTPKTTIAELHDLLSYNAHTGKVCWKVDRPPAIIRGTEAGNLRIDGKRRIKINGQLLYTHQVAWALYYGYWPAFTIDHRNRVGDNNRIANLREATPTEQSQNRRFANECGHRGVRRNGSKFAAQIQVHGKKIHLGTFERCDEAIAARLEAESRYFGEFSPL